ncbi:MAG: sugar ABC transporter permease [Bacteroidetes bacterium]|nr:sugar ABC transporter permease [Bacteroidota bacterium]
MIRKKYDILPSDYRVSIYFVIPAIISVLAFLLFPFIYTVILSLSKFNLMDQSLTFRGLDNYISIFSSKPFIHSISITVLFALYVLICSSVLGVLFALLLNQDFIGRGFARAILIIPWAIPWVVIGIMWKWMLNAQFGLLNGLLFQLGLIKEYIPFLALEKWVLFISALPAVWRQASFSGILLLASIQTIPNALYESAMIDGAGTLRKFFSITLPWMMPTLIVVFMFNTLYGFMQFDTVFMLTKGGPGDATEVIAINMYRKAFESLKLGEGAAIGYVLSMLCLAFGLVFTRILRKVEDITK